MCKFSKRSYKPFKKCPRSSKNVTDPLKPALDLLSSKSFEKLP